MKARNIMLSCAAMFLLSGCTSSLIHMSGNGVTADSQYPEYVNDIRRRTNDNGLLEVQVTFLSSVSRNINYKIEWIDERGYTLRNPVDERYRALSLTRNESYVMQKLASDKRAKDIKIHIK